MSQAEAWSLEIVWNERDFHLSDELDELNKVTPDDVKYIKNTCGEFDEIDLVERHRKV